MTPRRYLFTVLAVAAVVGVLHVGSAIAFYVAPKMFYFRAWEYFVDIVYRVQGAPLSWRGQEKSDLGRDYLFRYQETRPTTVTVDQYGFRVSGPDVPNYPVVMGGDSQIFGSGLSDDQTVPWRLSELIGEPVFNGSRTDLANALEHPKLKHVRTVIDTCSEHALNECAAAEIPDPGENRQFRPLVRRDETMWQALHRVSPERYSLILIAQRDLERLGTEIKERLTGVPETRYRIFRYRHPASLVEDVVEAVRARRKWILSRGAKRYVFVVIPSKQTLYADGVDPVTQNTLPRLLEALAKTDIEFVDLLTAFRSDKARELYFDYDSHWNERGADLAAHEIARQAFSGRGN